MSQSTAVFDKYEAMGAYHWRECDRRSKVYNPPLAARYEMVLRQAPQGRVLDVGAGDGYLSGRLAEQCREVVGLEYEPSGVALAQSMLQGRGNVSVRQGDSYALPFEDASFDGVVMADVIEHLDDPDRAVAEMARVVRDDGVVLVTTPHWRSDRVWDERHVMEYTAEQLRERMAASFAEVTLQFGWPKVWSDLYRTRVGWRLLRAVGRLGVNPFFAQSDTAAGHYQILAICRRPRRTAA
ncbi:SAM-dependent methyltransferase [Caulobacter ginsengisoli]|uniref:SAM-dependent methyltransferase n=1 Tax=Caulobacter ginsengisoli TaxID=400775 RepID=A0ABU0IM70_9CAUL|nr:class I SAM-dependent methyltransferase [Caulobacter ginsengisoli]MDQ0463120.1 SAM-dependent methyltransferase [Caulobacter ginsengisoli]